MLEVDRKLADVKSDSSLKEKSVEIKEKVDSTFTEVGVKLLYPHTRRNLQLQ